MQIYSSELLSMEQAFYNLHSFLRATTTARLALNDCTIRPQRPHDWPSTTARFRRPVRMSFQRLEIPLEEVK